MRQPTRDCDLGHSLFFALNGVRYLTAPSGFASAYGATKHAVRNLMKVLRMESAQEGSNIRTATIYPAAIRTELLSTITDPEAAQAMQSTYDHYQISPSRERSRQLVVSEKRLDAF